jgi:glutathione S-transferase
MSSLPELYSFRRCPYAIRARLAIAISGVDMQIREVDLKAKPERMLQLSPKGTVPVLVLPDGSVIDESLDIMLWALRQHDPQGMLESYSDVARALIARNDGEFKSALDRYKYPERYPEFSMLEYRGQGEIVLKDLNARLDESRHLCGEDHGIVDMALMPFSRQFAQVDRVWFDASPYTRLRKWLRDWEESEMFVDVMRKSRHR